MSAGKILGSAFGTASVSFPEDDRNYEVVNGQRIELPPMSARESDLASQLIALTGIVMRRHGRPQCETLFLIDPENDLQRRPDLAFLSVQRWPRGRPAPSTNAWEVVPDLAVEVVSATNGANEIVTKIHDYFRCGVRLVWVVFPLFEQIYVYSSINSVRILSRADILDGGDVLPGLNLPLADLFEREEQAG